MRPRLALFVVLLLAPFAAPVAAQPSGAQPLDRLLPEIRRTLPGQFLDAEPGPNEGGSPSYRLKWLTPDGRVIWRDVDARNGRVMGADREAFGRQRFEAPQRPNFRPPGFDNNEDGAPRGRFGNRAFGPRPDVRQDSQPDFNDERAPARDFNRERFNRPSFGDGAPENRGNFGGRRFGGDGAAAGRGAFGNRPVGGGRGRGRGREE